MYYVITYRVFIKFIFNDYEFNFSDFKFSEFLLKVKGKNWEDIYLFEGK